MALSEQDERVALVVGRRTATLDNADLVLADPERTVRIPLARIESAAHVRPKALHVRTRNGVTYTLDAPSREAAADFLAVLLDRIHGVPAAETPADALPVRTEAERLPWEKRGVLIAAGFAGPALMLALFADSRWALVPMLTTSWMVPKGLVLFGRHHASVAADRRHRHWVPVTATVTSVGSAIFTVSYDTVEGSAHAAELPRGTRSVERTLSIGDRLNVRYDPQHAHRVREPQGGRTEVRAFAGGIALAILGMATSLGTIAWVIATAG